MHLKDINARAYINFCFIFLLFSVRGTCQLFQLIVLILAIYS